MKMQVTRVRRGGCSTVEPPLDDSWDSLTKLRWHAAVTAVDTGIDIRVDEGFHAVGERQLPDHFAVIAGNTSSVLQFHDAWSYLNGVAAGARATAQRASSSAADPTGPDGDAT